MKLFSKTDQDRYDRTRKRQRRQREWTKLCEYKIDGSKSSNKVEAMKEHFDVQLNSQDGRYPLISEGVLVDIDGNPYEVIGKGSLKRWYDSLDDNTVYDIDLDHNETSALFRQIGTWSKKDLELTAQEDGRYSLSVKLNLDEESIIVKELRRKNVPLALSIEFYSTGKWGTLDNDPIYIHDDLDIVGFAIVSEPQDAFSGNIDINSDKGGFSMEKSTEDLKNEAMLKAFSATEEVEEQKDEVEEVTADGVQDEEEVEVKEEVASESEEVVEEDSKETFSAEEADKMMTEKLQPILDQVKKQQEENDKLMKQLSEITGKIDTMNSFSVNLPSSPASKRNSTVSF